MAKFSDVNNIALEGGAEAFFRLKEVLKAAGWIVNRSSDGTTYNAAGDQITLPGQGAGGMRNDRAWFEIQEPETNGRSWTFQLNDGDGEPDDWRIKLSAVEGFSGGAPDAVTTPSAADEQILWGSGTDAAPGFQDMFATAGTFRVHCIAESTPVGPAGNRAYGFWFFVTQNGSGSPNAFVMQEPLVPGTYAPLVGTRLVPTDGDSDPCVYICESTANAFNVTTTSSRGWSNTTRANNSLRGYYDHRGAAEDFTKWRSGNFEVQSANGYNYISAQGTGQHGFDVGVPPFAANPSQDGTRVGLKGYMRFVRVRGTGGRNYPDTVSLTTDAYVHVGAHLLLPWENGTLPEM